VNGLPEETSLETTKSTTENLEAEVASRFEHLRDEAAGHFKERPLLYTSLAAGAGFLLGGGLATATTLRVLRNSASLILQITVVPYLLTQLRDMLVEPATVSRNGINDTPI
jgi:hypothetical protein